MYSASSSLRAWTLRLPSLVLSSALSSLNVRRSRTASALTINGGSTLSPKRRPGPWTMASPARSALYSRAATPTPAPSRASNIQTQSQRLCGAPKTGATGRDPAIAEAASAVTPSTTMPHPGTAVNEPARSIVERMKLRLSSARSRSGCGDVMAEKLRQGPVLCQVLCNTKQSAVFEPPDQLEPRPDVVHRGDLYIHEPGGQGDRAHDVLRDVGRHAGRLLGPRDPQGAVRLEGAEQERYLRLEQRSTAGEELNEGKRATRRGGYHDTWRQTPQCRSVASRRVQNRNAGPGLDPELVNERTPRVPSHQLLHAVPVRVRLRLVHHHPMVQVRDRRRDVMHELRHVRELVGVDVLRLVRHLGVVAGVPRPEERDRNAVARIHVVIAAAVVLLRMAGGVELIIERKRLLPRLVHGLDQVAQLGREPAGPDELQVSRPPAVLVVGAAAAHHVHVQLRDDRVARPGGVTRERFGPPQPHPRPRI